MTKNAARKKKIRARQEETGEAYNAAGRAVDREHHGDDQDDREVVIAGLTELLARDGRLPVHLVPSDEGIAWSAKYGTHRWGVAEPAVDGIVIRELPGPAESRRPPKGIRVPVPYLTPDGQVAVIDQPPLVHLPKGDTGRPWLWSTLGWAVHEPGDIADAPETRPVADALPYEVREFTPPCGPGVVMEDYIGGPASWGVVGWCTDLDRARELADAVVAWHDGPTRAQVWDHTDAVGYGWPHEGSRLAYQVDAVEHRPPRPHCPEKGPNRYRPIGPGPELAAEPEWQSWLTAPGWHRHPPTYALHVWTPDASGPGGEWSTVAWCEGGRMGAGHAAAALRVGLEDGPYPWGVVSGPHHPNAWRHDWTQDGRCITDHYPRLQTWAEREPRCLYTEQLADPYEYGVRAWLTCRLEQGHVEAKHELVTTTEE